MQKLIQLLVANSNLLIFDDIWDLESVVLMLEDSVCIAV